MKKIFFILFIIILIGLVTISNDTGKMKHIGTSLLTSIKNILFKPESSTRDSTDDDIVGSFNEEESWQQDSTSYAETIQNLISKSVNMTSQRPKQLDSVPMPVPGKNGNFRDVLEEPYVSESRRLHTEIQENYKKITGGQNHLPNQGVDDNKSK